MSQAWDYLIVTASNAAQAQAYEWQLHERQQRGRLRGVGQVLVVADPEGRRVGSGGSTVYCLLEVLNREWPAAPGASIDFEAIAALLRQRRILIIHAGGDSRRLPAYGPCGKIFVPVPGASPDACWPALFDRLAAAFLALPSGLPGRGQVVVTAGDALLLFDPSTLSFALPGLTAVTCPAAPEQAAKHGVFCPASRDQARLYLQKPAVAEQRRLGALTPSGQALLDVGIMSFDSRLALALLRAFPPQRDQAGRLTWSEPARTRILSWGVDFYREICCALGIEATAAHHQAQCRAAGSRWDAAALAELFSALAGVPLHLQSLTTCQFLHFGTTSQLLSSGAELWRVDTGAPPPQGILGLNNQCLPGGELVGAGGWVEACRLGARLELGGDNAVIGLDILEPLTLPKSACVEVLAGRRRGGEAAWFVRGYGVRDTFKDSLAKGGAYCGRPLLDWLALAGVTPDQLWTSAELAEAPSLWDARLFPAVSHPGAFRDWLWVFHPERATLAQRQAFVSADRYSAAEIAQLTDQTAFFDRRRFLAASPR